MDIKDLKFSDEIILPLEGETIAITYEDKIAALFYDRIWSPSYGEMPENIRCFGGSDEELALVHILSNLEKEMDRLVCMVKGETWQKILSVLDDELSPLSISSILYFLFKVSNDYRQSLGFKGLLDVPRDQSAKTISDTLKFLLDNPKEFEKFAKNNVSIFCKPIFRKISQSFNRKHGIPMIPIYESARERDIQYNEGDIGAVIVALSNIKIVDEDNLTWGQVTEFRKDKEKRQKYKRFLHWLDKEMVGKSQAFVEDEIAIRLEDYESALKKHGIKTIVGAIQEALDGKYLIGTSGMAGSFTFAGHPVLGMLAAGLLIGGKVGVKLVQTMLDFDDAERGTNSEISWVYEVKKIKD